MRIQLIGGIRIETSSAGLSNRLCLRLQGALKYKFRQEGGNDVHVEIVSAT